MPIRYTLADIIAGLTDMLENSSCQLGTLQLISLLG